VRPYASLKQESEWRPRPVDGRRRSALSPPEQFHCEMLSILWSIRMKKKILPCVLAALMCMAGGSFAHAAEKTHTNSIGMEFVLIPAGSFQREINVVNEFNEVLYRPTVTISKPFYLGKYEVTQEQWGPPLYARPSLVFLCICSMRKA
jgi:formylglycine-generating enzyme required for sulfatase activity